MTTHRAQSWSQLLIVAAALVGVSGASAEESVVEAPPRPYVLLDVMHQFQRYADKLYFSGKARNWELANWYRWKLEAAAIPVIEGRVEPYRYEDYHAQPLMKAMLIPAVRSIENAINNKSDTELQKAYAALVQTCNGCHVATKHAFVKIAVPTVPIYTNQDYTP